MSIRTDHSVEINLENIEQFNNRTDIREFLLMHWIREVPHTKYRYFVEILSNGSRIYLERPGRLNKGCDFVIYAENMYLWNNGNDRPPDHNFVLNDLSQKKANMSLQEWNYFLHAVDIIYKCLEYNNALPHINGLPIVGHTYELLLKLQRWFFIEQDITYWSGQGRQMFYNAIRNL